jgi:transposase
MQRRRFSREFKIEAGVSLAQASPDIDVHENVLRKWVKEFGADPKQAFPRRSDEARAAGDRPAPA